MAELEKESRIKTITRLYYSNPRIRDYLHAFGRDREVVPSYNMEAFGKRPDILNYPADVMGLVNKGATSFHCSEELWHDALKLNSDLSSEEMAELRKGWDLLIDIDSQFLDYSKIAARLISEQLEKHGINNYGIKFSGSKGFHIIVPAAAFPESVRGMRTAENFPGWPRAIVGYLMSCIKKEYNQAMSRLADNLKALQERMKLSHEELTEIICPECGSASKKGEVIIYVCPRCGTRVERKDIRTKKKVLKCIEDTCPGQLEEKERKEFFYCRSCNTTSHSARYESSKKVTYEKSVRDQQISDEFKEEISASKVAAPDLVLVSSRHLFRMPYSLHEKTALASVVLTKGELEDFSPRDARPLSVELKDFYREPENPEARHLLSAALSWKQAKEAEYGEPEKRYSNYAEVDFSGVTEDMFPKPIKTLLKGMKDGKKRGLFVLVTFLKTLGYSPAAIEDYVHGWNKKNEPKLKQGYIKSQLDWHFRQKKKVLPPNYSNDSYYKDLKLLEGYKPMAKSPVGEVMKVMHRKR